MRCPRCGNELRKSKKDPSYGLCDNCRKKYKWIEEPDFDDYEEDEEFNVSSRQNYSSKQRTRKKGNANATPKRKPGCLINLISILVFIIAIFIVISAFSGGDDSEKSKKAEKTSSSEEAAPESNSSKPDTVEDTIPTEYKSALSKAQDYSDVMYMSKQGIYEQLTSEYGEKFSEEAAQYAIDNLNADFKNNALKKAEDYQNTMNMSPEAIRDQLVSEHGENFTQEEADYAIENLK